MEYEEFEEALRKRTRDFRLGNQLTQTDLAAKRENLRQSTIAKFENGNAPNVTLKTMFEIASALSLPLSELIKFTEDTKKFPSRNSQKALLESLEGEMRVLSSSKKQKLTKIFKDILHLDS